MNILVACEESQVVTIELRRLGHNAFSCDLIECSGGHPEWHIKQSVQPLLNGRCSFKTMDGVKHTISGRWDMILAFPPCTYLTVTGNRWLNAVKYGYDAQCRWNNRCIAICFFLAIAYADCDKIAIENPVGCMNTYYRKPDQIVQPYMFGDPFEKKTCLWLKGLRPLDATNVVPVPPRQQLPNGKSMPAWYSKKYSRENEAGESRQTMRSKTFPGFGRAMAMQWAGESFDAGVWVDTPNCDNICSECGKASGTAGALNECPNCGSIMRTNVIYPNFEVLEEETYKNPWRYDEA